MIEPTPEPTERHGDAPDAASAAVRGVSSPAADAEATSDEREAWARAEALALGPPPARALHVWIDLDNLPHVPVFAPLIALLEARGHRVSVTARRHAFTLELLEHHGIACRAVGRHPGRAMWRKVAGTLGRAARLAAWAWGARPDVAVGHGSRSGAIAARLAGVPALTMFDYEHVHAEAFLSTCRRILLPAALPDEALPAALRAALDDGGGGAAPAPGEPGEPGERGERGARGGASSRGRRCTVGRFPGYKEQLYLDRVAPDPAFRERVLGMSSEDAARRVVAVLREPASTAHYHHPDSDVLFRAAVEWLRAHRDVATGVLLPRLQGSAAPEAWRDLPTLRVLDRPVDGLQLIAAADLVVSGGGTMNREAALLGVPTYSIFRGRAGALDAALEAEGRLRRVGSPDEVAAIACVRREGGLRPPGGTASRGAVLREIEALGGGAAG